MKTFDRIGLTLSGGGARGFAHVPYLEIFESLGIKPAAISGTSAGALFGGLFAAGIDTATIKEYMNRISLNFSNNGGPSLVERRLPRLFSRWLENTLYELIGDTRIEDMPIPFFATAVNYRTYEYAVLKSGRLLDAIMASTAAPLALTPHRIGNEFYVDGGIANNIPTDLIRDLCDTLIAVDLTHEHGNTLRPSAVNALLTAYNGLMYQNTHLRIDMTSVEYYELVDLADFKVTQYGKKDEIYACGQACAFKLYKKLKERYEI